MAESPSFINSLIWPATTLIGTISVSYIFKKPVEKALERLQSFKGKKGENEVALGFDPSVKSSGEKESQTVEDAGDTQPQVLPVTTTPALVSSVDRADAGRKETTPYEKLVFAVVSGNADDVKAQYESFKELSKSDKDRADGESLFRHFELLSGDSSAATRLQELSASTSDPGYPLYLLAYAYEQLGNRGGALSTYKKSFEVAVEDERKARSACGWIRLTYELSGTEVAKECVVEALNRLEDDSNRACVLQEMANAFDLNEDKEMAAIYKEAALSYDPADKERIFEAAYAFSHISDFEDISYYLYKNLVSVSPKHSSALNNLGVYYGRKELYVFEIGAFQKAADLGNSLAVSNIAKKLMFAGFDQQAEEMLESHSDEAGSGRIAEAINELRKLRDDSSKKESSIYLEAIKFENFIRGFARSVAAFPTSDALVCGNWYSPEGHILELRVEKGDIASVWIEGRFKFQLRGRLQGRGCFGTIKRTYQLEEGEQPWQTPYGSNAELETRMLFDEVNGTVTMLMFEGEKRVYRVLRRSLQKTLEA